MKYRHLFFDLDHTLWDFETNSRETLADMYRLLDLEKKGITDFEKFHRNYLAHNDKLWDRYRKGFIAVTELRWKRMWLALNDFGIGDEALARHMGELFLEILPTKKRLFPFAAEILAWLEARSYALHLITNGFDTTQRRKMASSGIGHFFREIVTSESAGALKPHRAIFDYALEKTGASRAESIMIGDTPEVDILGAREAGIDQVFVNHIAYAEPVDATYTVQSLEALKTIF